MLDKEGRYLGWLAMALALVGATYIAAHSWVKVRTRTVLTIDVTGSAKRRIVSDLIEWNATISTRAPDRTAAYRQLRDHVATTLEYLKSQGVSDAEMRVQSVETNEILETEYLGSGEQRIERQVSKGFQTTQSIVITSTDVAKIERISREVTGLMERGVPIESSAPSYFYTKLGEVKIEMLAEASKDARTRAERILDAAGKSRPGRLRGADMGVINVNPANSTATSWEGNNDTTSLDKDIVTIVHCTYEID